MHTTATILWHRIDAPGHDACRLERNDSAWQLDGAAVFRHDDGRPAQLHYRVRCDAHFHTQWATVRGWLGGTAIDLSITRTAKGWCVNDTPAVDLAHCPDLDLGFTPATNLLPIRRLHLKPGEKATVPAAWLDLAEDGLGLLEQQYQCLDAARYAYASPRFDYSAELRVTTDGFVADYPRRWAAAP